jgi:hypothetical protein
MQIVRLQKPHAEHLIVLSVSGSSVKEAAKATVVGNIVSTAIQLNGVALPAPWAPLNVIA